MKPTPTTSDRYPPLTTSFFSPSPHHPPFTNFPSPSLHFPPPPVAHKTVHGTSPNYMRELVEIDVPLSSTNTRAKVQGHCYRLKIPKLPKNNIDNRRFSNYAPVAWNSLPLKIRCLPNTDSFNKGLLKNTCTIYFNSLFYFLLWDHRRLDIAIVETWHS
jgi:hypothetical protein